jgi:hypothetical protein
MATTAAVVGGASYVGTRKATQVGQEEEARQQGLADGSSRRRRTPRGPVLPQPKRSLRPCPPNPTIAQLKRFAELHNSGVLSDEEIAQAKAKLLGGL